MNNLRRYALKALVYAAALGVTVLATIVLVFAVQARLRLPDLHAWHTVSLGETASDRPESFAAYRALEERLFAAIDGRVLASAATADALAVGRYNPASEVAKLARETPYNRSFELVPEGEPRGGAVLVHGLSDSPYSMRGLAETLLAQDYRVLALRLPGHGTLPSGLVDVRWQDWYAALAVAVEHVTQTIGADKPLVLGGYSTGAALVTLYSVRALEDPELPRPEGLYLLSPAIGISQFAVLTNVISALSFVPWFEKSRWIDVLPEYDPYKYNSFPVNAANQIYRLTRALRSALDTAGEAGRLDAMPRVVVFQSIVDSTITASEVVQGLLARLPSRGHELVVFDVNRSERVQGFIAPGPLEDLERLRNATGLAFRITLVGNQSPDTPEIALYTREAGAARVSAQPWPLAWPIGVFSLGHVALPFPPDDPVYGIAPARDAPPSFNLGTVAVRGESGAVLVPLGTFARLRSNPFFDVIRAKIVETLPAAADPGR